MIKRIGVAIIGFGMSGKIFHLPPLIHHPSYEVLSILTNNPSTVESLHSQYPGIRIISKLEEALEDKSVDLIIIATPNEQHVDYTRRSLLAGKHVVVEKPFTQTLSDAQTLYDLAKKQKKLLRVFHNRQYDGDILTVHDVVRSGKLGKILSFSTRFDTYTPILKNGWRDKPGVMPGVFFDLAPHLVDHALRLFGLPKRVYAQTFIDRENAIVDDHFEMTLYYDSLVCYLGAQKLDRNPLPRFRLIGEKATYVKYGFDDPDLFHYKGTEEYHPLSEKSRILYSNNHKEDELIPVLMGQHYRFYDRLAEDIHQHKDHDPEADLALAVVGVMELAQLSMKEHRDIPVPESF